MYLLQININHTRKTINQYLRFCVFQGCRKKPNVCEITKQTFFLIYQASDSVPECIFWPKIAQKCQKPEVADFGTTRCGFSQKLPNLVYFTDIFGVFEQFLAKPIW